MRPEKHSCPFCGRFSKAEPRARPAPHTHRVDRSAASSWYVVCWFCGAHGPLSGSPDEAIKRWNTRGEVPSW